MKSNRAATVGSGLQQRFYKPYNFRIGPLLRDSILFRQTDKLAHHLAIAIDDVALGNLVSTVLVADVLFRIAHRREDHLKTLEHRTVILFAAMHADYQHDHTVRRKHLLELVERRHL